MYDVVSSSSGSTGVAPFIPSSADSDKIVVVASEEEEDKVDAATREDAGSGVGGRGKGTGDSKSAGEISVNRNIDVRRFRENASLLITARIMMLKRDHSV